MEDTKMTIGIIGTGAMGLPMALNLLKGGFKLAVLGHTNRGPIEELTKAGASEVEDLPRLVSGADIVLLVLPSSKEVESVVLGDNGLLSLVRPGQIVIDMGTSHPVSTRKVSEALAQKGAILLDAPVSGGVKGAEAGTLAIMVGGDEKAFETCRPVFDAMGKSVTRVGGTASGHAMKLINNLISLTNVATLAQVIPLAVKQNLDPQTVLEVLSASSADSWALRAHLPKIMDRNFAPGFRINLALKDMYLGLDLGKVSGADLGIPAAATKMYEQGRDSGMGDDNNAAIVQLAEKLLGIEVSKSGGTSASGD
jgi:3-hydroxyisobutyrate dehydrogenase-like beta-hydroxyacid dehydrogenase